MAGDLPFEEVLIIREEPTEEAALSLQRRARRT